MVCDDGLIRWLTEEGDLFKMSILSIGRLAQW